jgi:hypothetical protein
MFEPLEKEGTETVDDVLAGDVQIQCPLCLSVIMTWSPASLSKQPLGNVMLTKMVNRTTACSFNMWACECSQLLITSGC